LTVLNLDSVPGAELVAELAASGDIYNCQTVNLG
jgi:hypothetical protein